MAGPGHGCQQAGAGTVGQAWMRATVGGRWAVSATTGAGATTCAGTTTGVGAGRRRNHRCGRGRAGARAIKWVRVLAEGVVGGWRSLGHGVVRDDAKRLLSGTPHAVKQVCSMPHSVKRVNLRHSVLCGPPSQAGHVIG
jgi:hypothetical protein